MQRPDALLERARQGETEFSPGEMRDLANWLAWLLRHAPSGKDARSDFLAQQFGRNDQLLEKLSDLLIKASIEESAAERHRSKIKLVSREEE